MSSPAIQDLVNLVESLPDTVQIQVIEHLREYIADLQDEQRWDKAFNRTQSTLVTAARHAKQQHAAGQATPLNDNQL
ncbi:MAG: hypothetical protein P5702_22200 [Limnospira sp. PMC 1291.21]|uniref:hypothetical protein n=1 Tax=unclassified Limnospira TaxID=2642885 RepID=UPI0028E12F1C|nr:MULTISPECIES: hypothetical protein [unclassified Limnospira]MDT9180304.1 hypothetical protein [Limnospira sp. PMC 1238.20]MDT9195614.1 hypothetical protein [Limnospira sp. PMC 1245.20]MDT9205922.1 hypothetical protein [Limnospira sp. PMC 1243.20]MDT9211043.1 hypothetical protein [Limnospira sp. PMC 1252.20]MDT9216117.1 hypothetical protein [Limnospira sp. PMC 1256.20]